MAQQTNKTRKQLADQQLQAAQEQRTLKASAKRLGAFPDPVVHGVRLRKIGAGGKGRERVSSPAAGTIGLGGAVLPQAQSLVDLEAGLPGGRPEFAPDEILPNPFKSPIDTFGEQVGGARFVEGPIPATEDRLRRDRANFAVRQRAEARRQRLGLPPRQLGALPSLRTFARIRDASQISDAQIPGGVPTLNAPIEQINPDNLQDNQVYRTVGDRFVRFNAEDGSFTDMVFNPRGGPNQEGAFEIDPDVDDPAATDIDELINARLVGLTSQRALESLDPVLSKNIRQRGIAVQAVLDSDLSPQQKLETVKPMLAAMERLFPEESPEEGPLPIHEAKDKFMDIDDEGNVTILNPSTGAITYTPAKPEKDTVPLTTGSTVQNYITKGSNYKNFYVPFLDIEIEQIEDALATFVEGGLQAHDDVERRVRPGFFGFFGFQKFFQEDVNAAQDAYLAANLPLLDEILQPTAKRLLEEMLQPGVIPTDDDKLINSEGDEIPRVNFIFNQISLADLSPELTKLANDQALIAAGDQFDQVLRPGLKPGVPEAAPPPSPDITPVPDKKVNVGGSEMPVIEKSGVLYPAPATPAAASGLPPGTIYMLPDGTLKKIPKEVADGK